MNLNVVIVGHIDHGKSTLIGRLLYDSESLPDSRITEIQKLLEEYKKNFEFAYFLDSFEEELKEERTIDTTRVLFKGKNYYTIVDVPGHKEFIKNMLSGACYAQVAILVVSAPDGVQEQTRRHTFLLKMLGVKNIIVAINKMDIVGYQQSIFGKVGKETMQVLSLLGYSGIECIPVSAMEGDNIYKPSDRMEWYQGLTLLQTLDGVKLGVVAEKPLRFIVQGTYSINSEKVIVGRIESGILRKEDALIFQPSIVTGNVEKIKVFPNEIEQAETGDSIGIVMGEVVERGNVGGHLGKIAPSVNRLLGEVVILKGTMKEGSEFELKCGTKKVSCLVEEIKEQINSETGEVINRNIKGISQNEAAIVVLKTAPLFIEKFKDMPQLGRFILAKRGENIGAGIVLSV